jgi:hypothetical protein
MRNALDDLTRPAAPFEVLAKEGRRGVIVLVKRPPDSRVEGAAVYRHDGTQPFTPQTPGAQFVCVTRRFACRDRTAPLGREVRYLAVVRDEWATSFPTLSAPLTRSGSHR